jgi:hypothetical protein
MDKNELNKDLNSTNDDTNCCNDIYKDEYEPILNIDDIEL